MVADVAIDRVFQALTGTAPPADAWSLTGAPRLRAAFPVSDLATASFVAFGLSLGRLLAAVDLPAGDVVVDRGLADSWFSFAVRPVGWTPDPVWDAIAGDYRCADGWVRLHTNAAHHRRAALRVLGVAEDRDAVAAAVATWPGGSLEAAVIAEGGCAALMRTEPEWAAHPQGLAVAAEPLVTWTGRAPGDAGRRWRPTRHQPLAGLRVLDLTRVIAGPVATRQLAGYGATVLRVDPPWWTEPGVAHELTLGKAVAGLDLREVADRRRLRELLAGADVLVHGYRADALDRLGLDAATIQSVRPGVVDVRLDAYGWSGPWRNRRGFDSLVQMSTGIAATGMGWASAVVPTPLPVQALDFATGYLAAACVLEALVRLTEGAAASASLSLAATARLLAALERSGDAVARPATARHGYSAPEPALGAVELPTPWGPVRVLEHPVDVGGVGPVWRRPPRELRSDPAEWPTP